MKTYMYVCVHTCTCMNLYVHMYVMYVCINNVCMYVCMYECMMYVMYVPYVLCITMYYVHCIIFM